MQIKKIERYTMSSEQLKLETLSEVKWRNQLKIQAFQASENEELRHLADKLKQCRKGKRCRLLACSVCLRLFRKKYLKRHLPIWKKLMKQCPVHYVSAINRVPVDPNVDTLGDFKEWFERCLKQYGFDQIPLVGGVDYSWNCENGQIYLCQHLHFLVAVYDRKPLIECLKKSFLRGNTVSRPVYPELLNDYSDLERALNYTIPAYFEKRCRYLVNKRHYTKHYPLSDKQGRELYLFLSSNIPEDLMIVHDVYPKKGGD